MAEAGSELTFDRAAYEPGVPAGPLCASCKGPLGDEYWNWQRLVVCTACKGRMEAGFAKSLSGAAFGRAALLGGLTALGCGIAYAVFAGVTHTQLALVTIGIAFVVARVVRKASGGLSGRRFQVLAVALTYFASTMGYAPAVYNGLRNVAEKHAKEDAQAETPPVDAPAGGTTSGASKEKTAPSAFGAVLAIGFMLAIMLAAPLLEVTESPLGLLIVGFGLWEAWRLSRGLPLTLNGPYRVAPEARAPPPP